MRFAKWILVAAILSLNSIGCTPAQSAQDQVLAQQSIVLLNDAWQEAAKACLASGQAACRKPLETAYGFIQVAANASDAWTAASAGQYACAVGDASSFIVGVFDTLNLPVPTLVADGLAIVRLVGQCPTSAPSYDAGGA